MEIDEKKLRKEAPKLGIEMIIALSPEVSIAGKRVINFAVLTTKENDIEENDKSCANIIYFLSSLFNKKGEEISILNLNSYDPNPFLQYDILYKGELIYDALNQFSEYKVRAFKYYVNAKYRMELIKAGKI